MNNGRKLQGAIAATRFGLGARPGEIDDASHDPIGWVLAQSEPLDAPGWHGMAHSSELIAEARRVEAEEPRLIARRAWWAKTSDNEQLQRIRHMVTTTAPFRERWAAFWRNHFALKLGPYGEITAAAFAREVIDPHLFGRFEDMAAAAAMHPAMLFSLDQSGSVGPRSVFGQAHGRGLNENLARETLELHTLGVRGGYSQADVTELAKALTGWTVAEQGFGAFLNDPARREPGPRRVLGQVWPETDDRAERIVRHLARQPATAEHLATKLARHFVADTPPAGLVKTLSAAFTASEGDLKAVARALATAPDAWVREQRKFKTPVEFVTSLHRATGALPETPTYAIGAVHGMGQLWVGARSPDGWSDDVSAWATPQGVALRAQYAWAHAHAAPARDSREFAQASLGALARRETNATLARGAGPDRPSAFALVAMSPEFQRR